MTGRLPHVSPLSRFRGSAAAVPVGLLVFLATMMLPKFEENEMVSLIYLSMGLPIPWVPEREGHLFITIYAAVPLIVALWGAGRFVKSERVLGVLGWISALACFAAFMIFDFALWREDVPAVLRGSAEPREAILVMGLTAATAAGTLAALSLCVAPLRLRLAACVGLAGIGSLLFFAVLPPLLNARGDIFTWTGVALSAASSALISFGSLRETLSLWRSEAGKDAP